MLAQSEYERLERITELLDDVFSGSEQRANLRRAVGMLTDLVDELLHRVDRLESELHPSAEDLYIDRGCTCEEVYHNGKHIYIFTGPCIFTGKPYTVRIPGNELFALRQGAYIQDALVSLNADDREFVMTGISPEGWVQEFGEEDADGDYSSNSL